MKKTLTTLILCALTPAALAADTYGYLAMWQNPADSNEVLQIKTTKENATQLDATAELETFCKGQDALAGIGAGQATGCKTVVPLHNTCIAVAYPKAMGKLTAQNVVAITSPRFKTVHQIALNQCIKKYGSQGQCALETVYCTSETYYQGTVKTLWEKIKSRQDSATPRPPPPPPPTPGGGGGGFFILAFICCFFPTIWPQRLQPVSPNQDWFGSGFHHSKSS